MPFGTIGRAFKGHIDKITDAYGGSVMGYELEDEKEELKEQIQEEIAKGEDLSDQMESWVKHLEPCANYTSALLYHSSDLVHGIVFCYKESPLLSHSLDEAFLTESTSKTWLDSSNVRISIPSDILKRYQVVFDTLARTLPLIGSYVSAMQIRKAREKLEIASQYNQEAEGVLNELKGIKDYILDIYNNVQKIFSRTFELDLSNFYADGPDRLSEVVDEMESTNEFLSRFKGNAFTICKSLINLASVHPKVKESQTEEQLKWIADRLYSTLDLEEFWTQNGVCSFVKNFFQGTLLIPSILSHLPEPSPSAQKYISELDSTKEQFSSPSSSEYDPPEDLDWGDFPSL